MSRVQPVSVKVLHASDWASLPERGTPTSLRIITWIAEHTGRSLARLLLYPISVYFLVSSREARRASREYLKRLCRPPRPWHLFRHFHYFAETILYRVYLLKGEFDHFEVAVHGKAILQSQIETGSGCILLGSHLGSFEVLRTVGVSQ